MLRKSLLLLAAGFVLLTASAWYPEQGTDSRSVMSDRLDDALGGEGPWVVWVFFRDKGLTDDALEAALDAAEAELTPRAARRRAKVTPEGGRLVDENDLDIVPGYLARAEATGAYPRQSSRWLNAASYRVTRSQAEKLAQMDCVEKMDLVNRSRRAALPLPVGEPVSVDPQARPGGKSAEGSLDYGTNHDAMVQVNVPPLHEAGLSGKGVLVGMLDSGFRVTHEALVHVPVLAEWDFVNNDDIVDDQLSDPEGSRNHGTWTLSTVAGKKAGSLVAPAFGVSVVLAKTEDISQEEPIEEDFWVAGLEWAEAQGADLINSSLTYFDWYTFSDLDGMTAVTTVAAGLANDRGLVVLNSAGNSRSSTGTLGAPADGVNVLTVGAVDPDGLVTYFSSPGPTADGRTKPDVAALGVGNTVVHPLDDVLYLSVSGTSFSCPVTAGVVALMLERVPQLTPIEINEALRQTASQSATPDNDMGWGIVDAWAAATWFGPVIDHDLLPDTEDTIGPYSVVAVITDRVGVDASALSLHYRLNKGSWTSVPMTATGTQDTYAGAIPGQPDFTAVEYYLEAGGTNGYVTSFPYQGADSAHMFTTGPWRRSDYSASVEAPIPDGVTWGVISEINVPMLESGSILDVTVDIDVTHPDRGELEVHLTGPDGTLVTLHDQSGGGAADLNGNWSATLTVDGPGTLEDYFEHGNRGDWTLQVVDMVNGNTGIFHSWDLHFTLVRYVTPVVEEIPFPVTQLGPNVPNPFNPRTRISFDLARPGQTRLSIFDVRGMLVANLLDEDLPAGPHTAMWDGLDRTGRAAGSGTYFYRLESGPVVQARKMLLIR